MSISNVVEFEQHNLDRIFGENQGYWEYRTINDEFLCYTVRKKKGKSKIFLPYIKKDGILINEWHKDESGASIIRPIYNVKELYERPDCPVLLVEGEKTADAGKRYFPEMVCITWMGGSGMADNFEIHHLTGREVFFVPDNDEPGEKTSAKVLPLLQNIGCIIHHVNVKALGVPLKWDIANLDDEYGVVDVELALEFIRSTPVYAESKSEFDILSFPHLGGTKKNPKPLDMAINLKHLLGHFKINNRWNMMNRKREVTLPDLELYYEEKENMTLNYISDLATLYSFPLRRIDKHLDYLATENKYHPIRNWILSRKSEEKVFEKFLDCIKTTNDPLSRLLIKRWMLSAVAAAFSEGNFACQGVLVIHGPQYTHKSSFVMSLAPPEMKSIKGAMTLDVSNKDDIFTACSYWIVELAELDATFRKSDIAKIKGFATSDEDVKRRAFAPKDSQLIRRTIFAATVNEDKFLVDTTGNRRWWTISITEPINTRHGLDMQQVWREVYEMWLAGESPNLSKYELILLNQNNQEFESIDPFEEKVGSGFCWESTNFQWMTCTQILEAIGYDKPNKSDTSRMANILKKFNVKRGEGRGRRTYQMPPPKFSGYATGDVTPCDTYAKGVSHQ